MKNLRKYDDQSDNSTIVLRSACVYGRSGRSPEYSTAIIQYRGTQAVYRLFFCDLRIDQTIFQTRLGRRRLGVVVAGRCRRLRNIKLRGSCDNYLQFLLGLRLTSHSISRRES